MIKLSQSQEYSIGGVSATEIAKEYGTPLYVYDISTIESQYNRLDAAFSSIGKRRINYAMKALSNINILRTMRRLGSGIDAVSINEVMLALKAGFAPSDIIYTPSGVDMEEIDIAVELGVNINIDSMVVC